MTYTTSTTKTKAAKYDLLGIEDMVPNIWSPVKIAYDKHALWGISHWREQHKSFYAFARVRLKLDNHTYNCKEGDYPTTFRSILSKNNGLILVVENQLTNLSGDDVADFAIALRMFTRSLVIQKKRHPYTPYKDPQGFIYVDDDKRNILMGSEELYKFSDGTLTRLLSSLKDITKNIDIEYLPKSSFHDQGHQQAAKGKKDDNSLVVDSTELTSDCYKEQYDFVILFDTPARNPVNKILLKLNLSDHRSILTDSKGDWFSFAKCGDPVPVYMEDRVPTSFNQDHVDRLKAHTVKLHDILEGVLVQSGVSRVWRNPMCDPVLRRSNNTEEIAVTRPDRKVVIKADNVAKQKASTRSEISTNVTKKTRSSKKGFEAGSSRQAVGDGVEQADDGTLDDDDHHDDIEFPMKDIESSNNGNQDKEVEHHVELFGGARRTTRAILHASHVLAKMRLIVLERLLQLLMFSLRMLMMVGTVVMVMWIPIMRL
ncbi:hypothetical protein Tco_1352902 [Tanacetum coccineum]